MGILQIFTLLGALGMFLYGMNLMSSGLHHQHFTESRKGLCEEIIFYLCENTKS